MINLGNAFASNSTDSRLLIVFLRGGNDGVNTIIPDGDGSYFAKRPGLSIASSGSNPSLALNGYARLNPFLTGLHNLYGMNRLACLTRIGTNTPTRSHFTEQKKLETLDDPQLGMPPTGFEEEGYVPRMLLKANGLDPAQGLSHSGLMQRSCQSIEDDKILVHLRELQQYKIGNARPQMLLKARLSERFADVNPNNDLDVLLRNTGQIMLTSEADFEMVSDSLYGTGATLHDGTKFPTSPADMPPPELNNNGFFKLSKSLEESFHILDQTASRVACVEMGGFDTHQAQGPAHDLLMQRLDHAMVSFHDCASASSWGNCFNILVMSEFGRTNAQNGSIGTDHGVGGVCLAIGPNVKGGVFNCAAGGSQAFGAPWQAMSATDGHVDYDDAIEPATHFHAVLGELARKHFGITNSTDLDAVIPNYGLNQSTGATRRLYRELGYLL